MQEKIKSLIQEALKSVDIEGVSFVVEHPTDLKMGDYSTNVAIKFQNKKDEIFAYINAHKPAEIEKVELAGPGFINFFLSKEFFKDSLGAIIKTGDKFGKSEHAKGYKVMVEHTQPNPFKEFHIGHLMNNAVGEAVANTMKANSAEVKVASYHGDVGLHVAKAIWGKMQKPDISWGEAYALGAQSYDDNKEEIIALNKKIYDKSDSAVNELYEKGRSETLESFEKIYEKLGSTFDYHFYESEAGEVGKELVLEKVGKVFEEGENGAIVFRGENFEPKTHTRVFLNSEGLPTYEAKEVGLAKLKKEKWQYDGSVTITANEQDSFFDVVEVAIGQVFPELKGKLKHLSHGMLKLPTGKMSSRTGDVITAETLIEEVKGRVKGNEEVAVGAIKYMILKQAIGSDIIFDFEKSVSTEGDSGVYLQYAHARANSILEKADKKADASGERKNTHELERLLYRFPEVVERAGAEYAPHHIATYLTELAASFNNFYAHEPVLEDSPESAYRLAIVQAFKNVMKNGLSILGIPAPERM